jgi:hypothetical protein
MIKGSGAVVDSKNEKKKPVLLLGVKSNDSVGSQLNCHGVNEAKII